VSVRPRRDRHGRGLRGPVAPADVPLALSRAEQFDELVLTALTRLERRWAETLERVEVVVEDVPDADGRAVVLGSTVAGTADEPARLVVYRRGVEARARGLRAREALVHRVVVEQLAELLGVDPETVDPDALD
jgi:hypothetical protein